MFGCEVQQQVMGTRRDLRGLIPDACGRLAISRKPDGGSTGRAIPVTLIQGPKILTGLF